MLRAVPVFGYSTKAQTLLGLRFLPSPAQAAQAARSLMSTLSLGAVHLIPASVSMCACWVHLVFCSGELVSSRDPPGRYQSSRISGSLWLETGSPVLSLVGDAISGAYFAPFPSPSASCLQRGMGRSTTS